MVPSEFKKIGIVKKEGAPKLYTLTLKTAQKTAFTTQAIQVAINGFFIRTQIPYSVGSVTPARNDVSAQERESSLRPFFFVFNRQAIATPNWEKFIAIKAGNNILS